MWHQITCAESDALHREYDLTVAVAFTDMDGELGDPEIRREWADKATGELVVKDIRYPSLPKPCEHYRFGAD